ncbi:hypothetical protein C5L31_000278 [Secundilactobacillus malefermentans]|uniref:Cof-like hydrolase n=1 Tax=Secundilactobacillus malefermentans TaxID=176292 RepID=A0A4R5NFU4_9LACO|nr:Cof-type HAD-IIB family hydrolase [Secundilactobacillus malefermentans]KRM57583.1 HAD superfamily hydrolase [Secundilactobacillus malefermentans DSM 5705 = KCTC 3548]TDG72953.1 hypothetical protein C5L31_000278 [Secundilactobacillus malefermentans]
MINMIALNLDNTLLTNDKRISQRNEQALKKLHEAGMMVVLCTGRPINAIWKYIEQLGLTSDLDYTITFNGALVIHNTDKKVLAKQGLKLTGLAPLYEFAKQHEFPLDVLDFDQVYPVSDLTPSIYQQMLGASMNYTPTPFAKLGDGLFSKAVMASQREKIDLVQATLDQNMTAHYHIVRSQPQIIEFLDHDMDKAVGLLELLTHFNWTYDNLMTFGDAENDLGMIKAAKVGVSMANGTDEIKQAANEITLSNEDDGVAAFTDGFFK